MPTRAALRVGKCALRRFAHGVEAALAMLMVVARVRGRRGAARRCRGRGLPGSGVARDARRSYGGAAGRVGAMCRICSRRGPAIHVRVWPPSAACRQAARSRAEWSDARASDDETLAAFRLNCWKSANRSGSGSGSRAKRETAGRRRLAFVLHISTPKTHRAAALTAQ